MIKELSNAYAKVMTIDERFAELERRLSGYRVEFRRELDIITARINSIDKAAIEEKAALKASVAMLHQQISSRRFIAPDDATPLTLEPARRDGSKNG